MSWCWNQLNPVLINQLVALCAMPNTVPRKRWLSNLYPLHCFPINMSEIGTVIIRLPAKILTLCQSSSDDAVRSLCCCYWHDINLSVDWTLLRISASQTLESLRIVFVRLDYMNAINRLQHEVCQHHMLRWCTCPIGTHEHTRMMLTMISSNVCRWLESKRTWTSVRPIHCFLLAMSYSLPFWAHRCYCLHCSCLLVCGRYLTWN